MKRLHENSTISYNEHIEEGKQEIWRKKIWEIFKEYGAFCDKEIQDILNMPDMSNIAPEITRMKFEGLLIEGKKIVSPYTGKKVRTCTVSDLPYRARRK